MGWVRGSEFGLRLVLGSPFWVGSGFSLEPRMRGSADEVRKMQPFLWLGYEGLCEYEPVFFFFGEGGVARIRFFFGGGYEPVLF